MNNQFSETPYNFLHKNKSAQNNCAGGHSLKYGSMT